MSIPNLAIGTAQFGLNYGVTNHRGRVTKDVVSNILKRANEYGIKYIDTAQDYGEAESVIGTTVPTENKLNIISKLKSQGDIPFDDEIRTTWQMLLDNSLKALKVKTMEGLLVHNARDLKRKDSNILINWLKEIKSSGYVNNIGVSIYNQEDLMDLPLEILDIVQLPCSLYNQDPITKESIDEITRFNIKVHARSIYLQGLLVTPAEKWPRGISRELKAHHYELEKLASSKNTTLIDLALGWAKSQNWIEAVVIGVTTLEELEELMWYWKNSQPWEGTEMNKWNWEYKNDLDPRKW